MPMVHPCRVPGCPVLTMGDYCIEHEVPLSQRRFSLEEALTAEAARAPKAPRSDLQAARTRASRGNRQAL